MVMRGCPYRGPAATSGSTVRFPSACSHWGVLVTDDPPDNMSLDDLLHWDLATTEWASQGADPVGYDFENSLSSVDPGVVAAPGTMNFHMLNPDELYMNSGSSLSDQSISDHSAPDHAAPPVTEAGHLSPHEQWIRKISDLNIKIYQHAAVFPPAASGIRRTSQHPSGLEGDGTTDQNRTIAIDRTFNFTTEVLEALELVSSPSPGNGLRNGIEPLDQGSLLLILSLYLRLLDLYYAIFEPLQKLLPSPRYRPSSSSSHYPPSFVSTDSPSPFPERALDGRLPRFPVLRIGEFSLQTSPSVHTLMTIQLAEQLLGLVNRAVQTITRNQSAANTPFRYEKQEYFMGEEHGLDRLRDSSGMDVAELSLKAVEKRHMEVMAVVKAIKWALTSR